MITITLGRWSACPDEKVEAKSTRPVKMVLRLNKGILWEGVSRFDAEDVTGSDFTKLQSSCLETNYTVTELHSIRYGTNYGTLAVYRTKIHLASSSLNS